MAETQLKLLEVSDSVVEPSSTGPRLKQISWPLRSKFLEAVSYHPLRNGSKLLEVFIEWCPSNRVATSKDLESFLNLFIQAGKQKLVSQFLQNIWNHRNKTALAS